MTNRIVDALDRFFASSNDAVLFTGAGVSMLAGLPDWRALLSQMADSVQSSDALTAHQMRNYVAKGNLTKAADFFWLTDEVLIGKKISTLKSILDTYDSKPLVPLASLPFKSVVTPNFDRSIIDAISVAKGRVPRDYKFGDASFPRALWEKELWVARIHGCVEDPERMVLSDSQFSVLLNSNAYVDFLTQIFLHRSVLFLGFSFYDPAIRYIFEQIDKRFGPAEAGRHVAILPESNDAEFVQKASRLNIEVIKYSTAESHRELWDGISAYAEQGQRKKASAEIKPLHPHQEAKQYLAACYARSSLASEHTPLREIVIEGIISAALQEQAPKSLTSVQIDQYVLKAIGIKAEEIRELVAGALNQLVDSELVTRHRAESGRGMRFEWRGNGEDARTLKSAIGKIKQSILDRAYVQEGWKPPSHVADVVDTFLKNIIHQRGWDLGAAFAAGRSPDALSFRSVFFACASKLSAFDRERMERTIESLFQRPTEEEASLLGELGRVSFALELAFQAPRTTLLHQATLPRRIYFDANLLLPAFVEGHPHYAAYKHMLARLQAAATAAGNKLQLIAFSGYLNEMMHHKGLALTYAREAGAEFEVVARSDALFHGPANINVYVGAYINWIEAGNAPGFESFLRRVAPYQTEDDLRRWLESKGLIVLRAQKDQAYSKTYSVLERSNAAKLAAGKKPILIEHDSLQLSLIREDSKKGEKSLFVTADRQLYEDVSSDEYLRPLAEYMVSHVGIVQFVDLMVGLKGDERALGELLWSSNVSDRANRIRSYLTIEALNQYDAALAMGMHQIIEKHTANIAGRLERDRVDLDAQDPKDRISAFKSLGTLESNFFEGMREAMEKIEGSKK